MFDYENKYKQDGYKLIAGIDEAGRGPLAGPCCVACCIMPLDDIIDGVNDSKKLSEKKREFLFDIIIRKAIDYKVVFIDNFVIDDINILNATKKGMKEALESMKVIPDIALIDAVKIDTEIPICSIIKGDMLSYSIACASILAKVSRDRLMVEYSKKYPNYLFEKHKGYGTKSHYEMIKRYGITDIHRRTFLKGII